MIYDQYEEGQEEEEEMFDSSFASECECCVVGCGLTWCGSIAAGEEEEEEEEEPPALNGMRNSSNTGTEVCAGSCAGSSSCICGPLLCL